MSLQTEECPPTGRQKQSTSAASNPTNSRPHSAKFTPPPSRLSDP
jgi:hypothetical protein